PLLALLLALLPVAGQEPKKEDPKKDEPKKRKDHLMIRWYGQSFFQIEDSTGRLFAIDPHGIPAFGRPMVKAEFVLVSHPNNDHALIEMIDTGRRNEKTGEFERINENDVYRGVVEPKPGKQEWKTIDEKRGAIRLRTIATYHDATNGLQRGKNSIW